MERAPALWPEEPATWDVQAERGPREHPPPSRHQGALERTAQVLFT